MPTISGEGPFKNLESAKLDDSLISNDNRGLPGFVVPWGFYYYNYANDCTLQMATASLASCIAVICSYNSGDKVFFAHISSNGEAKHIVRAIKRVNPSRDAKYTCAVILGKTPQQATTVKRVNAILEAAGYGFHIYQSTEGAVSYQSRTGELTFGSRTTTASTVTRREEINAMKRLPTDPLLKIDGSLDLDSQ